MRLLLCALLTTSLACGEEAPQRDAGPQDAGKVVVDSGPEDLGVDAGNDTGIDAGNPPGPTDGGADLGVEDAGHDAGVVPASIFMVGNSFTYGGDVPALIDQLANAAGFPDPEVDSFTVGGRTLADHRGDARDDAAPARIREGWDVVVLQEHSVRPTDSVGPAEQFKADATWFHDEARTANPNARVILYETWARRFNHDIYPETFLDPSDMQAQLRFHYADAAERAIPAASSVAHGVDITVAPCGDAWETQLAGGEPPKLHGGDDYHAGSAGAYLNALVLFSTIYDVRSAGLPPIGISLNVARELQVSADATTGKTQPYPGPMMAMPLAIGDGVAIDLGPDQAPDWSTLLNDGAFAGPLLSERGAATGIYVDVRGFDGTQTGGEEQNQLGLPAEVSRDSLWVGSFQGHEAAVTRTATLSFSGLDSSARYRLTLFASRSGDDEGRGRSTLYASGAAQVELDPVDNQDRTVELGGLRPDEAGQLSVSVRVNPESTGRFAYLGAAWLTREE